MYMNAVSIILALASLVRSNPPPGLSANEDTNAKDNFKWTNISPRSRLNFVLCYGGYSCARLDLPFDATDTQTGERIGLAVIKLPALVPVDDPRYGGSIIINPGGPGGSGIVQMLKRGQKFQSIVDSKIDVSSLDSNDAKYFDIVSFDPRGVGYTTPRLECFPDLLSQTLWYERAGAEGIIDSSPHVYDLAWARSEALAAACASRSNGTVIAAHMSTVDVVDDMVALVDELGRWRRTQQDMPFAQGTNSQVRLAQTESKDLLQYWGFSYGTIIGATFATLHPARVGRMILDGVSNAVEWHDDGAMTTTSIWDSDAVMQRFFRYCYDSGPDNCSFHRGNSWQDLESSLDDILEDIRKNPIAVVPTAAHRLPEIVTYSDIMNRIRAALYSPLESFEDLADTLADLAHRNGSRVADFKYMRTESSRCYYETHSLADCVPEDDFGGPSPAAIECSDPLTRPEFTKARFAEYKDALVETSKWLGQAWSASKIGFTTWIVEAARRLTKPIGAETAHPILLISTILDPVTPLDSAREMSSLFPGSVVLRQDSEGHCSYSSDSACTHAVVRDYFQSGILPAQGRICLPDKRPFGRPV